MGGKLASPHLVFAIYTTDANHIDLEVVLTATYNIY